MFLPVALRPPSPSCRGMAAISTPGGRMLIVAADQRNGMKAVIRRRRVRQCRKFLRRVRADPPRVRAERHGSGQADCRVARGRSDTARGRFVVLVQPVRHQASDRGTPRRLRRMRGPGDSGSESFTVAYLRRGSLIALDCVNTPRDFAQGRALVEARAAMAAADIADTSRELKTLPVPAPAI